MSEKQRTTVLFARQDSPYKNVPGLDVWDAERDALKWKGGGPVIAHPPCRAWGALSHMKRVKPRPGEKELAPWAVSQVRKWGGVLEHPAKSKLWKYSQLPLPGELPDAWGGFTLAIDQYDFGHVAHKPTYLYIVGCVPPKMPPKNTKPTTISIAGASKNGGVKGTHRATQYQREATPQGLIDWLLEALALTTPTKGE